MKVVPKNKSEHRKSKKNPAPKPKKEHVVIVAQEIKFARLLAGNEQKQRDRALKSLKKWLHNCFQRNYEFKEHDFTRIWKGLFYAVWMSDKPLVQEELCENIASILDEFGPEHLDAALMMTGTGFKVLAAEWYGLDSHRIDKFLMLVRRYLRGSLRILRGSEWALPACDQWAKAISASVLHAGPKSTSMTLQVVECLLEEVSKVSSGAIPPASLAAILRPFVRYMCVGELELVVCACRQLLTALLRQSGKGIEYQERTRAWHQMGCPKGGPEALELEIDSENDEEVDQEDQDMAPDDEKPLDPRAGHVDVVLDSLPVPCEEIAAQLRRHLAKLGSKAHKRVKICLERFEKLSSDEFPLPVKTATVEEMAHIPSPSRMAHKLHALERRLIAQSDELASRGLSRKHRKRLLAKSRAGQSIIDEVDDPRHKADPPQTSGEWQVEETEPPKKKTKKQNADKENTNNKTQKQNGDASPREKSKKKDLVKQKKEILGNKQKKDKNLHNIKNLDKNQSNDVSTDKDKKVSIKSEKVSKKPLSEKTSKTSPENNINSKKVSKKPLLEKSSAENNKKLSLNNEKAKKPAESTKQSKASEKNKKPSPTVVSKKVKNFQKQLSPKSDKNNSFSTPKKVKFVLKNNSMQAPTDYYKSIRASPSIPFDSSKIPSKTNLKPSTPSPINPFFKKKLRLTK